MGRPPREPWNIFLFLPVDPHIEGIMVDDPLNHRAGWNRSANPDVPELVWECTTSPTCSPIPLTINEFVYYLNDVHLDLAPGTGQVCSNVGYTVLSEIVDTVKRMAYFDYLVTAVPASLALSKSGPATEPNTPAN